MYNFAVKHHEGCSDQMLKLIHAIPYHYSATDKTAAVDKIIVLQVLTLGEKYQAAVAQGVKKQKLYR